MGFRYDMRGKSGQQQAIVRQRDREEQRRNEERDKQSKQNDKKNPRYEFDFEDIKNELSEKELSFFVDYLNEYRDAISKQVEKHEELKWEDLVTLLKIGEVAIGNNRFESIFKSFQFIKIQDKIIKITKVS